MRYIRFIIFRVFIGGAAVYVALVGLIEVIGGVQTVVATPSFMRDTLKFIGYPTHACLVSLAAMFVMLFFTRREEVFNQMKKDRDEARAKLSEIPNIEGLWMSYKPDILSVTMTQTGSVAVSKPDDAKGLEHRHDVRWDYMPEIKVFRSETVRKRKGTDEEGLLWGYAIVVNSKKIVGVIHSTNGVGISAEHTEVRNWENRE